MTVDEVMAELESLGSEQQRKTYARHGATGPMFGVKIGDMKPIAKRLRNNLEAALSLYDTGNLDAMYLAGMLADGSRMTNEQLDGWARNSTWQMISESAVPAVACESPHARELALKWMDSPEELVATSGWHTYGGILAMQTDEKIDLAEVERLLERIESTIHDAPNRVRHCMNSFVMSVGGYVVPLNERAKEAARRIGTVTVDMGDTACKVHSALDMINKIESMGRVGKKRKTMKC